MSEQNSNYTLGGLLLLLGIAVLLGGYAQGLRDFASAEFFPALIALCMCVAGVWIALAGWLTRDIPPFRWTWVTLLIAGAIGLALTIALTMYFARTFLLLGPPEYAATIFLLLAQAVAFARRAHLRALGMVLIGLLLSTVGLDIITGRMRFTFGLEPLYDGLGILIVLPGMLIVSEAMLYLVSPQRWAAAFSWIAGKKPEPGRALVFFLRVLAVIAIIASVWLAYANSRLLSDVVLLFVFGFFGVVCLLCGWNRIVLLFAFYYGAQLEQSLRQSLVIADQSFSIFLRPESRLLVALGLVVLAIAFALWFWRLVNLRKAS